MRFNKNYLIAVASLDQKKGRVHRKMENSFVDLNSSINLDSILMEHVICMEGSEVKEFPLVSHFSVIILCFFQPFLKF